jgi:predicted phage terminase large subunit-like protein
LKAQPKINLNKVKAELCRRSFFYFLKEFIDIIEPNADNFVWNWHIEYLCDEAQRETENYFAGKTAHHLDINICPGATKSTIFSRSLLGWAWAKYPEATIINVTRDSNNNKEFATKSKSIIESEKYKRYFPDVKIKKSPDSYLYYENDKNGKRYAITSMSSGSTGKHADIIVLDDLGSYLDYYSDSTVESLENAIDGLLTRFKDKSKGIFFNVMQRLAYNDTTAYLFEGYNDNKPKLTNRVKKIRLPSSTKHDNVFPEELKERYVNGLLDPIRLSEKILEDERTKFSGGKFDAQYDQITTLDEGDLMYPRINEREFSIQEIIESLSAKISTTDLKDEGEDTYATIVTAFMPDGHIYVVDVIYNTNKKSENEERLVTLIKTSRCSMNYVESNNQVSYINTVLMLKIFNLEPFHTSSNKLLKIKDNSHYMAYVIWHKNHPNPEYQKALSHVKRFPRNGKANDDGIEDAFSSNMLHYIQSGYMTYLKPVENK